MKLIVDYFYDDEDMVIRKIYTGNDESALIKRAKENEHYSKCTSVTFDLEDGNQ